MDMPISETLHKGKGVNYWKWKYKNREKYLFVKIILKCKSCWDQLKRETLKCKQQEDGTYISSSPFRPEGRRIQSVWAGVGDLDLTLKCEMHESPRKLSVHCTVHPHLPFHQWGASVTNLPKPWLARESPTARVRWWCALRTTIRWNETDFQRTNILPNFDRKISQITLISRISAIKSRAPPSLGRLGPPWRLARRMASTLFSDVLVRARAPCV